MSVVNAAQSPRPITGRKVLLGFIGFFGIVFAMNGFFVYVALDSWPGLGSDNPYERGIAYNQTIAAAERQQALGWKGRLTYDGEALVLRLVTKEGVGVEVTSADIRLSRPASARYDRDLPLVRRSAGIFAAEVGLLAEGQWLAKVSVAGLRGETYRMDHRLTVRR